MAVSKEERVCVIIPEGWETEEIQAWFKSNGYGPMPNILSRMMNYQVYFRRHSPSERYEYIGWDYQNSSYNPTYKRVYPEATIKTYSLPKGDFYLRTKGNAALTKAIVDRLLDMGYKCDIPDSAYHTNKYIKASSSGLIMGMSKGSVGPFLALEDLYNEKVVELPTLTLNGKVFFYKDGVVESLGFAEDFRHFEKTMKWLSHDWETQINGQRIKKDTITIGDLILKESDIKQAYNWTQEIKSYESKII
jgi:hypothetical protein